VVSRSTRSLSRKITIAVCLGIFSAILVWSGKDTERRRTEELKGSGWEEVARWGYITPQLQVNSAVNLPPMVLADFMMGRGAMPARAAAVSALAVAVFWAWFLCSFDPAAATPATVLLTARKVLAVLVIAAPLYVLSRGGLLHFPLLAAAAVCWIVIGFFLLYRSRLTARHHLP